MLMPGESSDVFHWAKTTQEQALHNIGFDEVFKYKNKDGEEQT